MKQLLLTGLTLASLVMCASSAYGCFCARPQVPAAFEKAQAVFLGEVIDIVEPTTNEMTTLPGRFFTIRFRIQKAWKGVPLGRREFSVLSAQGRYGCLAFPPVRKGQRYLVYADPTAEAANWSIITVCNRTTLFTLVAKSTLLDSDTIDPSKDIKHLDVITSGIFGFKTAYPRRPYNEGLQMTAP